MTGTSYLVFDQSIEESYYIRPLDISHHLRRHLLGLDGLSKELLNMSMIQPLSPFGFDELLIKAWYGVGLARRALALRFGLRFGLHFVLRFVLRFGLSLLLFSDTHDA